MYKTDILEMHRAWARHRNPLAGGSANLADLSKLKNENAERAARIKTLEDRIAQLEKTDGENVQKIVALEADRDNWRKQVLEENAAADVAKPDAKWMEFAEKMRKAWHRVTVDCTTTAEVAMSEMMDELDDLTGVVADNTKGNDKGKTTGKGAKRTRKGK